MESTEPIKQDMSELPYTSKTRAYTDEELKTLADSGGYATKSKSEEISRIFRGNGFSSHYSPLTSTLYGIDISGTPTPAQQPHEQTGLTFFTRPLLKLSYDNIGAERTFNPMGTTDRISVGAYVQAILDPLGNHPCPLVDPKNPFIPLLGNTLSTLAGWQDPVLDNYTSPSGRVREQYSIGDSSTKVHQVYSLSASFRNVRGNVLGYLFHVWQTYIGLAYEGVIDPYPIFMARNIIDYQTRIYRLILDPTRTFVEEIVSCYACYPLANTAGTRANFNQAEVFNRDVDLYNQTFQAIGATYYDPVSVYEFNTAATALNPKFRDAEYRNQNYRCLFPNEYRVLSYRAYPWIDPTSARLLWWVEKSVHREIMGEVDYPSYHVYVQTQSDRKVNFVGF